MDNPGVRLPVDATAKSKFKAKGLTSHMKEEMTVDSRKVHREIICDHSKSGARPDPLGSKLQRMGSITHIEGDTP
jgi:hypothetical protein